MSDISMDDSLEQEIEVYLSRRKIVANTIGIGAGIVLSLLSAITLIGIGVACIMVFREQETIKRKSIAVQAGSYAGAEISKLLEVNFQVLLTLTQSVIQNNYTIDDNIFRSMAARLRRDHPLILAYEYALGDDMVLSYVDPMPSPVMGLKLMRYNAQHAQQIMKSIANNTITLYGPFNLIQGDIGLTVIYPIMYSNGTVFGISSVLIMLNDVLQSLDIYNILQQYNYQFQNVYGIFAQDDGMKLKSTLNTNTTLLADSVKVSLSMVGEQWNLYLSAKDGWYRDPYMWLEALVIVLIIVICSICIILVSREIAVGIIGAKSSEYVRDILEKQVSQRTKEIMVNNMRLVSQLEQREDIDNTWGLAWLSAIDSTITSANDLFIALIGSSPINKKLSDVFVEPITCDINKTIRKRLTLKNNTVVKATIKRTDNKLFIVVNSGHDDSSNASNKQDAVSPYPIASNTLHN